MTQLECLTLTEKQPAFCFPLGLMRLASWPRLLYLCLKPHANAPYSLESQLMLLQLEQQLDCSAQKHVLLFD